MSRKKASLYRWKQNNKCRLLCIRWQPIRSRLARHWMATLLPTWISTTHHTKLFFFVWDFIITQVYLQWCHIYESYNMSHRFWLIFHCWFNFGKFDVGVLGGHFRVRANFWPKKFCWNFFFKIFDQKNGLLMVTKILQVEFHPYFDFILCFGFWGIKWHLPRFMRRLKVMWFYFWWWSPIFKLE